MSQVWTAALLLAAALATDAGAVEVDLDKPGALEALERYRPSHHQRVMEEISKVQIIHVDPKPSVQKADTGSNDPRQKTATTLMPSNPAKKRLTIAVDGVVYRVTALLTKNPGKLEKAK